MIKPIVLYGIEQVRPRWRRIVLQPQILLVGGIGIASFIYGTRWPAANLKSIDIGTMILTYAAIAFGFCITGMVLVLTLPSDKFLKVLQGHKLDPKSQSSYLDLLFVFSWTAVCHWLLVVTGLFLLLAHGADRNLLTVSDGRAWRIFISWLFGMCSYSLIQFLLTVITLAQVGQLYSRELSKSA